MKTMIMTSLANKLWYQRELSELRNKHRHDWQNQAQRQPQNEGDGIRPLGHHSVVIAV